MMKRTSKIISCQPTTTMPTKKDLSVSGEALGKMVSLTLEVTSQFSAHVLCMLGQVPVGQSWARALLEAEGLWEWGRAGRALLGRRDWRGAVVSCSGEPSSGLPSSRKMRSYWREPSGGLRG